MNSKIISIIVIIFLLLSANGKVYSEDKDGTLRVYLPREITIKDGSVSLGEISIIRGDEPLVAKASGISLGRISLPGQEIILDRATILSRLACSGIRASKVTLTGAEKIKVKQQHRIIRGSEFVELANSFLEKNLPHSSVCQWNFIRASGARNQARIKITVVSGKREIGSCEVSFRLKYESLRLVTLVELKAGDKLSPENVKIEDIVSDYPEPVNGNRSRLYRTSPDGTVSPPYGLVVKHRLPAKTVIRPNMIGSVKPEIIVKRNGNVVIRIESPGLLITASGRAIQDGRAGEYIKVRNVDSQRIIMARVNEDGTVEPVL